MYILFVWSWSLGLGNFVPRTAARFGTRGNGEAGVAYARAARKNARAYPSGLRRPLPQRVIDITSLSRSLSSLSQH
jgi:hypothetical protein